MNKTENGKLKLAVFFWNSTFATGETRFGMMKSYIEDRNLTKKEKGT